MNGHIGIFASGAALLLALATPAAAHEVWVERDGSGPARIYLREIAEVVKEADETHRLKQTTVLGSAATLVRKGDHFEAPVAAKGDVRVHNDDVFAPWTEEGVKHGQVYHARAGRSETDAKLDFEFVPVASGSDNFTLLFRGKPVAGSNVTVFSPERWQKTVQTDSAGRIAVPQAGRGRYILVASTQEDVARRMSGEDVARVHHMTTLSYVKS